MLALLIWQVVLGHPSGKTPTSNGNLIGWTIFLWLVYLRLITVRLVTEVRDGELRVGLQGFWRARRIPLNSIQAVEIIDHDPARDYGGYGVRSTRDGRAYIGSAGGGVRLMLPDSEKLVIGSNRADELASLLRSPSSSRRDA